LPFFCILILKNLVLKCLTSDYILIYNIYKFGSEKLYKKYLEFLLTQKGKEIAIYDLTNESRTSDYVLIQHFNSSLDNKKFAELFMSKFGIEDFPEGYNRGEWIIFDMGEVVLHSFVSDKRAKYNLDKLWQNNKVVIENTKKKA